MSDSVAPRRQWVSAADVVDVFVYVVVLNLAVQFMPQVISETFTLSLFTAVVTLSMALTIASRCCSVSVAKCRLCERIT